ncbi:MAG: hypothetical protein KTR15_15075 [Phycisphaeraceae bacterium]|nr:hypothetical protein [Phycisphaeraceae bacterium]
MSSLQTTTSRRAHDGREQLRDGMRRTVQRGRVLASLRVAMVCLAAIIGGLFLVALKDAVFELPVGARLALLIALLIGALGVCIVLALRPWLNKRFNRAAGEQIDHAAEAPQQPVTVGLSLKIDPLDDDSLALILLHRAETRAAEVAHSIKPKQAYPLRRLLRPGGWLALAIGVWLMLVLIFPNQAFTLFARVAMPWGNTPPFSLTQLEPTWTPESPLAGEDVVLSVEPSGLMPESVDWVLLDEKGNEAERFAMTSDGQGGFSHLLSRVQTPIDFRLEAHGRHTRSYTIAPTPSAHTEEDTTEASEDGTTNKPDGSTAFDPDKIARRNLDAHRDWPGIKADLERLLEQLGAAQSLAQSLDPADGKALKALAKKLAELTDQAQLIAGELTAMRGDLPADAAALLDDLAAALTSMQSAALPAPPSAGDAGKTSGQPTPADWLDQVREATRSDQQRIGQGVGPSDLPTESGTASGQPGDGPAFRDPNTSGAYNETNVSGDDGPLPEAVMQQVPPSYRVLVSTYFERLAEDSPKP